MAKGIEECKMFKVKWQKELRNVKCNRSDGKWNLPVF